MFEGHPRQITGGQCAARSIPGLKSYNIGNKYDELLSQGKAHNLCFNMQKMVANL